MELNENKLAELANWFFDENASPPAGILNSKVEVALGCFNQLFLKAPESIPNPEAIKGFEEIMVYQFHSTNPNVIDYHIPYPKYEFLLYLIHNDYLLHGSKNPDMNVLEPREQIDWNGTTLQAVFATGDASWPMYFALLERHVLTGSLRNGCFLVEEPPLETQRFYFFSVNRENLHSNFCSNGIIYILDGANFRPTTSGTVRFDEWASEEPIPVLAKLPISPADFPFLHHVTGHDESESIFTTWLRYRERLQVG